jgi:hypothetical protein
MSELLGNLLDFIIIGIQVGLLPGVLAGAITWSIMKTPDSLFKGIAGFVLGFVAFTLFRGQDLAQLWSQIAATAGGSVPRGLAEYTLTLGYQAIIAGLVGMAFALAVTTPANTIKGALFGGVLGIILGIVLQVVVGMMNLPVESVYYSPAIGLIVLVIFAIFGAGS